jgi:1-acyl-sn-glycerol-3-phosphate acyltransferase
MLYFFRMIATTLWVFYSSFVGILAGLARPFDPRNTKITVDLIAKGTRILGIKMDIRDNEILDLARPCVFICNHQSNLDIFTGGHVFAKNTVTIGKKSLLFIPFFGQFFWLAGNLFIDRKNKKKAVQTMDVATAAIKDKKLSIWIMPEGTRSKGRGLLPFKKGAFLTAIKAQVPIVPIAISSYTKHLDLKVWSSGKIIVQILPPIITTGLKIEDATRLKDQCHLLIKETIEKLDHEIESEIKNIKA